MDRQARFSSLPVGPVFLTVRDGTGQIQPLPGVPMVGIGPAWALAIEVGGDFRAREQGRNCPSLLVCFSSFSVWRERSLLGPFPGMLS